MPNSNIVRKTHITRICGVSADGDRLDDWYVDIERIDVMVLNTQTALHSLMVPGQGDQVSLSHLTNQFQEIEIRIHWRDDPDNPDDSPGAPFRTTVDVYIYDVDDTEDLDNLQEYILIPSLKRISFTGTGEVGYIEMIKNYLQSIVDAANSDKAGIREVTQVRYYHHDTAIDKLAQAAYDADPGRRNFVLQNVNGYGKSDEFDKSQHIEVEVIHKLTRRDTSHWLETNGTEVEVDWNIRNEYLVDQSDGTALLQELGPGDMNPPWRLDPFQNIINVQYGGYAVEYGDEEYSEFPTVIPSSRKFTFAVWFRVEQESVDAAKAEIVAWKASGTGDRPPLCGVVPVVVMGHAGVVHNFENVDRVTGHFPPTCTYICTSNLGETSGHWVVLVTGPEPFVRHCDDDGSDSIEHVPTLISGSKPCDPSYIGVDCSGDYPMLSVNIIMPDSNKADFVGSLPLETSVTFDGDWNSWGAPLAGFLPEADGGGPILCSDPGGISTDSVGDACLARFTDNTATTVYGDTGAPVLLGRRNETFRTLPQSRIGESLHGDAAEDGYEGIRVEPGRWHLALVSFDGTKSCKTKGQNVGADDPGDPRPSAGSRTSSAPRMYVSMDDVNYTGQQLSVYFPQGYSDQNAIVSVNGYYVANEITHTLTQDVSGGGTCQGGLDTAVTEQQTPTYSLTPRAVQLSPMGVPVTGEFASASKHCEVALLQGFLDVTVDWQPVAARRAFITNKGRPAPLKAAEDYIGKKPEILVRRRSDLKLARNIGTLATGDPLPTGIVGGEPTSYRPDPSLHGKQG